jgi:hypothetical protein
MTPEKETCSVAKITQQFIIGVAVGPSQTRHTKLDAAGD